MHTGQGVIATFSVVTPMFLGGAEGDPAAFRAASLRGALRFWWRAVAWAECLKLPGDEGGGQGKVSPREALAILRRREVLLFGDTHGQGRLSLSVEPRQTKLKLLEENKILLAGPIQTQHNKVEPVGEGARYLGYRLMAFDSAKSNSNKKAGHKKAGQLSRDCILPGQGVRVRILVRPLPSDPPGDTKAGAARKQAVEDLARAVGIFNRALRLFGLLGGLGGRARRGWGSVALHALEADPAAPPSITKPPNDEILWLDPAWTRPATLGDYTEVLGRLLDGTGAGGELPPFTAFGAKSRVEVLIPDEADPLTVLDGLGRGMQRYRSWGKGGRVHGRPSEKNFQQDHDWSKGLVRNPDFVPERTVFGLPHNYGEGAGVKPAAARKDRRASPLLLHVHPLAADWYIGVGLILPAQFLPPSMEKVILKLGGHQPEQKRVYKPDWSILTRLLEGGPKDPARLKQDGRYFPEGKQVWPR